MVWHKIADNEESLPWQENNMCLIEAGGKMVTLARFNGSVFSFAHKCPHASGIMADGYINAAEILSKSGAKDNVEPYLFICRHAIELLLKSIIMLYLRVGSFQVPVKATKSADSISVCTDRVIAFSI